MVGQRDGPQIEPGGLLDEFLRRAGAVEEAVRRMRVQLGIRDRRDRALHIERLILPRLRDQAGLSPPSPFGSNDSPARRGLPVSTRSISVQLGGPVNQLISQYIEHMF